MRNSRGDFASFVEEGTRRRINKVRTNPSIALHLRDSNGARTSKNVPLFLLSTSVPRFKDPNPSSGPTASLAAYPTALGASLRGRPISAHRWLEGIRNAQMLTGVSWVGLLASQRSSSAAPHPVNSLVSFPASARCLPAPRRRHRPASSLASLPPSLSNSRLPACLTVSVCVSVYPLALLPRLPTRREQQGDESTAESRRTAMPSHRQAAGQGQRQETQRRGKTTNESNIRLHQEIEGGEKGIKQN